MFTPSVFGVIVGLCCIVFLLNVLPDTVVLEHHVISQSPVASFSSLPRLVLPVLLTKDVVLTTESRWFAISSDSGAEAKPSPTASVIGIKKPLKAAALPPIGHRRPFGPLSVHYLDRWSGP